MGSSERSGLKERVQQEIMRRRGRIIELSHRIHAHPELGHEEKAASEWVAHELADAGLTVQKGAYSLPTAVFGRVGKDALNFGVCAEYDALPGIGHACGHNMIAAAAVATGWGLAGVVEELGITLTIIGTPAEEVPDRGGKVLLLERGAFDGISAAMMIHPCPFEAVTPTLIAAALFEVHYTGRAAHASAAPEAGINAADALTVAQVAIGLLRQQLPASQRVHGITVHAGDAVNIIPARASGRYMVRAPKVGDLDELKRRVEQCFEAGALATGCQLEVVGGTKPYAHMVHDKELARLYQANAETLGREFRNVEQEFPRFTPSSDMGNVSQVVPSIHPYIKVDSWPVVNHQPEFAAFCVTSEADQALLEGAIAMAWTIVDAARDSGLRKRLLRDS